MGGRGERVRPAGAGDHAAIARIERAAGEMFRGTPLEPIADDEPPTPQDLERFVAADGARICEIDGVPRAYVLVEELDDAAHVEQVSVDPTVAGRRIGARLLDVAADWARARGLARLTLTTFVEVPWNAPYYRRLGFVDLPPERHGPQLAARLRDEAAHGLDRWPRTTMVRAAEPFSASRTDRGR